jgi:anti-sigma regulatory factor (Ser/Thr protein kinase)
MSDDVVFFKEFSVTGKDFTNAGSVSTEIKAILKEIGFDRLLVRRAAIASYEAEMNVVMYAKQAVVRLSATPTSIKIEFQDEGQGIENVDLALQEGYSTATPEMREMGFGAGMGLPNIKRNADDFDIKSEVGKGTHLIFTIHADGKNG